MLILTPFLRQVKPLHHARGRDALRQRKSGAIRRKKWPIVRELRSGARVNLESWALAVARAMSSHHRSRDLTAVKE